MACQSQLQAMKVYIPPRPGSSRWSKREGKVQMSSSLSLLLWKDVFESWKDGIKGPEAETLKTLGFISESSPSL